eukprot:m.73723 g.73723  ORF g.73723 m.73723 type:complete len:188 (+) comp12430_c0_seq6:1790-2353(+)
MMQVLTPLPKIVLSSVRDTTGSLSLVAAEKVLLASSLGDVRETLKQSIEATQEDGILLDMLVNLVDFCRKQPSITTEKTVAIAFLFLDIHKLTISTPYNNYDAVFEYFKKWIDCHNVHRPPWSEGLLSLADSEAILHYGLFTFFRHFNLHKYAYTTENSLTLNFTVEELPELPRAPTPPPEDSGTAN